MESLSRSLNYELPQELHFDKYTQHILENSRTANLADSTPLALAASHSSINSFEAAASATHQTTTSDFLKKLGATFIHSIQLQSLPRTSTLDLPLSAAASSTVDGTDMDFDSQHLMMDSHNYNNAMDELQKQLNYDKFMNEVWIGVVLTLILISMIFCFCSCFLYHQFRVWKRNYRTTITQTNDVEAVKLNMDIEDPVPEYTLVSGLPSYEAALELLHKSPHSCMLVHPSVFEVFNRNEKSCSENCSPSTTNAIIEATTPLLSDSNNHTLNKSNEDHAVTTATTPHLPYNHSLASLLSLATQISTQCKPKSAVSTPTVSEAEKHFKP